MSEYVCHFWSEKERLTFQNLFKKVFYFKWLTFFKKNTKIANSLQDIEKLGLIVGCLCHDLDHRGTNNMFQVE